MGHRPGTAGPGGWATHIFLSTLHKPALESPSDPRIYFAAERTLLAWVRTALGIIGLGFVVTRFGVFLRLIARPDVHPTPAVNSTVIGVSLVVLGTLTLLGATVQYVRFCRELSPLQRPARYWTGFATMVAYGLALVGAILATYLTLT